MEKQTKRMQLDKLLNDLEIQAIYNYLKKRDLKGAKKFLNAPERKIELEAKGISADYLYYQLEYIFSTKI
jgi:hypothetical protein